jgi:hypothetical protein
MSRKYTAQRLLHGKSPTFGLVFNKLFVEIGRVITTEFHNDLHLYLVLAAITNNSISRIISTNNGFVRYAVSSDPLAGEYEFIKLLPLSEIVGLPRTTVRRKVERLIAIGYIEHKRGMGYRTKKGVMGNSPAITSILDSQFNTLVRLINEMLKHEMVGVTPRNGGAELSRPPSESSENLVPTDGR